MTKHIATIKITLRDKDAWDGILERISDLGLDNVQQKYLALLAGGPQRLNVLASMLGVSTKVLTKTVEPFLLRYGLVVKDDGGRRNLTEIGQDHLTSLRPANG